MESLCLFNFGLRSRIRNISKIRQSNLFEHFLSTSYQRGYSNAKAAQYHVDMKYKHSLLRTMLNRAFKLSSTWQFFHQECERLKEIFTRLHYPEPLIQNTIRLFVEMKVTGSKRSRQQAGEIPVRIPLPFKDQRSANKLREQVSDLSRKIKTEVHPVFTSHKIKDELKAKEPNLQLSTSKTLYIS